MNRLIIAVLAVVLLSGIAFYVWQRLASDKPTLSIDNGQADSQTIEKAEDTEVYSEAAESIIDVEQASVEEESSYEYEPPAKIAPARLPLLDESDDDIAAATTGLVGATDLFIFSSFIRHFVVTIDNIDKDKLPKRYAFMSRVKGKVSVIEKEEDQFELDSKTYRRYKKYVDVLEYIDTKRAIAYYVKLYALFDQAYKELGYPERDFNRRLIEVLGHLLETPDVGDEMRLIRPKVFYEFAESELEELSAGQKILLRIGGENRRRVKAKLGLFREELKAFSGN